MIPSICLPDTCDLCQFLRFNDAEHGGFVCSRSDTIAYLGFPDHRGRKEPLYGANHQVWVVGEWDDALPGLPDLKELVDEGCRFAQILRNEILESKISFEGRVRLAVEYEWQNGVGDSWGLMALTVRIGLVMTAEESERNRKDFDEVKKLDDDGNVANWNHAVQFAIESGDGNCAQWLALEPAPAEEVFCEANVASIRHEVSRCMDDCHPPRQSTFTPTRLLDLGDSETDEVRLIEMHDGHQVSQYVALSYCWGPPDAARTQLKTETHTLKERKHSIPLQIMSRVMQDAIKTTRLLSIRYLWIDALCIIQDDNDDWEREAASMGRVYSNAALTLCALSSSSCHEGFLQRTSAVLSIPFQSRIDSTIKGSYTLRAYPVISEGGGFRKQSDQIDQAISSWVTRAWTFQEYELSTRVLFFGKSRIHFACPKRTWVEGGHCRENPKFEQAFIHHILDFEAGTIGKEELYSHWLALLERYGNRKCTYASDKLPAVSGIAKLMAEAVDDTYVAGMWTGALAMGLLWSYQESTEHNGLEEHVQACRTSMLPSWTWVAQAKWFTHGHSLFWLSSDDDIETECKNLSTLRDASERTLNAFGGAKDALLLVTGQTRQLTATLERVKVTQPRQAWKAVLDPTTTVWVELDYSVHHTLKSLPVDFKMVTIASVTGLATPNQSLKRAAMRELDADVSFSDYSSSDSGESNFRSDDGRRHAWGLLLHPAQKNGQYHRVGIFTTRAETLGGLEYFNGCDYEDLEVV